MFKKIIQKRLERLAKKYLKKHKPKLILVTGSVGKTSTKLAIATVLSERFGVRVHEGNHNSELSVPLGILGIDYPDNIHSLGAWLKVHKAAKRRIKNKTNDCDVIVQELGTDAPGDIPHFGTYLKADIAVVTAVSPEHMQTFGNLDAVAQEELAVAKFSERIVINRDDIDGSYSKFLSLSAVNTYGVSGAAEYRFETIDSNLKDGFKGQFIAPEFGKVDVTLKLVGEQNVKAAVAAGLVGAKLGLTAQDIANGQSKIQPVHGRMNIVKGLKDSTLIDDTYNSSPLAAEAALRTLYGLSAGQKIAILGSMNELGTTSAEAHKKLGEFCNGTELAWVITIGKEAEEHLAPAAKGQGCQVKSFSNPYDAGAFAHKVLERNAIVLAKGSQNGVFAEEALKILLHNSVDERQLVRQSAAWLEQKQKQFAKL